MKTFLLILTLCVVPIKLTKQEAGQIIRVKPNQYIQVILPVDLSTGYDWYIARWSKTNLFRLEEKYISKVGNASQKWFTFQTKTAGQFDVEFLYKKRTFEPIKTLNYTFKVTND